MAFKMRTTKPEAGNKYYITKANGGYSTAIQGNPKYRDNDCDVLSNCVGYALGRFNEIGGYGYCKYLKPVNAEKFIEYKDAELKVGQTPKVGACMVWQKGKTLNGSDGAGHVAIVEKVISNTEVYTSESGWNSKKPFWNQTRKKGNGNWGEDSSYKFLGFIYNPAVKDEDSVVKPTTSTNTNSSNSTSKNKSNTKDTSKIKIDSAKSFKLSIAGTYRTTDNLNIRCGAGTSKTILTTILKGEKVTCYGYYTAVGGVKWYYVVYKNMNGKKYTGFVSSQWLKK